ncbi:MAG: two-component system response regulator, partial [Delftia sp.]|nr:two-component system response regulator [Delftia sp.]
MANILVVDDELGIRDLLSEILNDEGHSVDVAENAGQARSARASNTYDLVL